MKETVRCCLVRVEVRNIMCSIGVIWFPHVENSYVFSGP